MQAGPSAGRNSGINIVRGYLIIGVVLVHLWADIRYTDVRNHEYYVRFGERLVGGEWTRLPTSILDVLFSGGYLIPSFMMLSGLSLYLSTTRHGGIADVGAWMFRRMRLLFVPYWFGVGLVAATIVAIALVQMALHGDTLLYQLKHVTMSKYDYALQGRWEAVATITVIPRAFNYHWLMVPPGILWFVILLAQYYLVFPLLFRGMQRLGAARFVLIALAATVTAKLLLIAFVGALDTQPARHINHVFIPFRWYEFALGMGVGYLLANQREVMRARIGPPAVIAAAALLGLSMEVTGMLLDDRSSAVSAIAAPIVVSGMTLVYLPLFVKEPGRLEATWPALFFAMCGPLSYAIVIANEPLRLVASFLRVEDVPTAFWWAYLVAYIPLTVLLAKPIAALLGIGPRPAPRTDAPEASGRTEAVPVGAIGGS
jgi:peptidoglycan/LPS O-acetylase OafA/YrhL